MNDLNQVPKTGTFGDAVDVINTNFALLQMAYQGMTQSDIIVGSSLPSTGESNKIYRISGSNSYTDYMWNGTQFVKMAQYDNAIDNTPTINSNNLVKSGGVYSVINSLKSAGYIFAGVATTSTSPGTPTEKVFYIGGAGTYANFGTSVVVPPTNIAVFKYDGTWTCEQVTVENGGVFDISAFNAVGGTLATYTDLAAALGTNGANIPEGVRKGGMSIKFVQSSDNKYVQARCMAQNFTTDVTQWQGVDVTPVNGSHNLVESGGAYDKMLSLDINNSEQSIADESDFTTVENNYINISGISTGSNNWNYYKRANNNYKEVKIKAAGTANAALVIAFFNTDYVGPSSLISGIQSVGGVDYYSAKVPANCKLIVVSNRKSDLANPVIRVFSDMVGDIDNLKNDVSELQSDVDDIEKELEYAISSIAATKDDFTLVDNVYRTADGTYAGSNHWHSFNIENEESFYKVKVTASGGSVTDASIIAFYNSTTPGASALISSVTAVVGQTEYEALVPNGCKLIIVSNRKSSLANPTIYVLINGAGLADRIDALEDKEDALEDELKQCSPLLLKWVQGGIDDSGDDTTTTLRIRSNYLNGNATIWLKTGYSVRNIFKYKKDGTFDGKVYASDSAQRREAVVSYDGYVRVVIQKTANTALDITDDFLRDVYFLGRESVLQGSIMDARKSLSRLDFVQGGIDGSGAVYNDNTRIVSNPISGNFTIELNDGYILAAIYSYYPDGTKRAIMNPLVARSSYSVNSNAGYTCRIAIKKADNTAITPDADCVKSFVGGDDMSVFDVNKKAVKLNYRYGGNDGTLPSAPEDVYAVYDSFVEKFPQFASKETIGSTRKPITFTVDNINLLPVTVVVSAALTEGDTLYVGGDSSKVVKVLGYYNDTYGGNKYAQLKAQSDFALPSSSSLTDTNSSQVATYNSPAYGRCTVCLGSDSTNKLSLSEVNSTTEECVATYISTEGSPSASGVLKDEEGNTLANYSSLVVGDSENIYCYTFNFSNKNRSVEDSLQNNIFVCGGVHGYEPKAVYGHMMFFKDLFENWKYSDALSEIRSAVRFTVIPCCNPWGLRNNRNYNCRGVDINRNFPNDFAATPELYFRWSGDAALSEPEAQAISTKMLAVKAYTMIMVDFHNEGGYFANMFVTATLSTQFANAVSRAITIYGQRYYNSPQYLFGWVNGSSTRWTDTPIPEVGDRVFSSASTLSSDTISVVGTNTITVGGTVYTRSSSKDVDYTNLCNSTSYTLGGMIAGYASYIGIRQSSVSEVANGYFLSAEDKRKMQVEITGNYLYALVDYFLM